MNAPVIAILNLGPVEIVVILLVALLVFGRRLPEVARSLGQGLVEFRKGLRDEPALDDEPRPLPDEPVLHEGEEPSSDGPPVHDGEEPSADELVEYDAGETESGEESRPAG